MNILSMDFGTSSIKLSILDERYTILRSSKIAYQIRIYNGDWSELDGEVLLDAMLKGIKSLDIGSKGIDLICFCTFSPSLVLMDGEGNPVYPIFTHLDRRSKKQTRDIIKRMGKKRFQEITGIQPFTGGTSITSAMWLREHERELFDKTVYLGHLNTFIYRRLTGRFFSDRVNASMTGMYETITMEGWSQEICEQCGIPIEILPPLAEPGSQEGFLTLEMANLCGLQEGIPVALGTNDAASALMGAGNFHNGDILNISGSSEMVSVLTNIPRIDDRYYLRCSAVPGLWQIYATTAGGFALDWFRKEFCKEMDEQSFFQHEFSLVVEEYLAKTKVHFKPYLAGDRQSLTPKTGVFSGLTLYSTREDLLAAMLLGIHEPIRTVIQTCETFMQLSNTIRLTGGMVNPAYLQVKQMLFPNYRFEFLSHCPIIGNVKLALPESDRKGEKIW